MRKNNETQGYTYFILTDGRIPHYSFDCYVDNSGDLRYISKGRDQHGNELKRRFEFRAGSRKLSVPNTQADVIEFLRNHPECEGSINGSSRVKSYFKELNLDGDAEKANQATAKQLEAMTIALNLKDEELRSIGVLFGALSGTPSMIKHSVLEVSQKNPAYFLEVYNEPERQFRSILLQAVNKGVVTVKGTIHAWGKEVLGSNEDEAVAKLVKDKEIFTALKKTVEKV